MVRDGSLLDSETGSEDVARIRVGSPASGMVTFRSRCGRDVVNVNGGCDEEDALDGIRGEGSGVRHEGGGKGVLWGRGASEKRTRVG